MTPSRRLLGQLAVALATLVLATEALVHDGPLGNVYVAYLFPAEAALYFAAGLLAWWRRPANHLGSLMTAAGGATLLAAVANTAHVALIAVGTVTATLPLSVIIHLVLAAPQGRLRGRAAVALATSAYAVGLLLQVPLWAFAPQPPPFDVLLVTPRPELLQPFLNLQRACGAAVIVGVVALLAHRLRGYAAPGRRLLGSLLGYAIFAVVGVEVAGGILQPLGLGPETIADVQIAAVALVPLGLLVIVLRGGFMRPGELDRFVESVAASGESDGGLEAAVAVAVGDPSAAVHRWDGEVLPLPADGPNHRTVRIEHGGRPLGALSFDPSLGTDPATVRAVSQVVGIALERERLAAEVAASRVALQEASQRVATAGDEERRRMARDLHDGLQGQLVLLSLQARQFGADGPGGYSALTGLAEGIDAAARTLRGLVEGVMPGPLVERGLGEAVRGLASELPLAVEVDVDPALGRRPGPSETTAYFVVAEALTNVVKHARATVVEVRLRRLDEALVIEVTDDGIGGADGTGSSGLAGLRDRVAVLGGGLEVSAGHPGTLLRAWVPWS